MGSNMAEAHPVGFRWPMKAKENGAKLIHVDPRFTRTSALCDVYVGIRAGSDIAFLGGLINYVLTHERWFKEYVLAYTNACDHHRGRLRGHRRPGRPFQRLRPGGPQLRRPRRATGATKARRRPASDATPAVGRRQAEKGAQGIHGPGLMGGRHAHSRPRGSTTDGAGRPAAARRDAAAPALRLPDPASAISPATRRRWSPRSAAARPSRWCAGRRDCSATTPAASAPAPSSTPSAGRSTPPACRSSAPPASCSCCWQHRPARRRHHGHARPLQHPGLDRHPHALRPAARLPAAAGRRRASRDAGRLRRSTRGCRPATGPTSPSSSSACSRPGTATRRRRRTTSASMAAAHRRRLLAAAVLRPHGRGEVKGYFLFGQNPGGGGPNAGLHRAGLRNLDWLVVLDWFETESAVFWKNDPNGPPSVRDQDRGLLHSRRRDAGEGRQLHQHAAADPVARQGGRPAGRLPLGRLVRLQPRQAAKAALRRHRPKPRTSRC